MPYLFWLVICSFFICGTCSAAKCVSKTQRQCLEEILESYDINEWPHAAKGTHTKVGVELYINAFGSLNAANMDYSIDAFLRQRWSDWRLIHPFNFSMTIMDLKVQDKIWKPDTFFENVKDASIHQVTRPNILLRIENNGDILYSMRMKMTLTCGMAFQNYPLDQQICGLKISTYANTEDKIVYNWMGDNVTFDKHIEIAQFDLLNHSSKITWANFSTGNFSGLAVDFTLLRQNGYHVLQTYIPTVLIVMISWVSFWLDPNAVPGRVTLGVTTLLTLTTLASGIRQQLPPVSYVKAIDVWVGMCMIMVFGALLEFTLVNWLANKKVAPESRKCPVPRPFTCFYRQDDEDGSDNKEGLPTPATYRTHARAVDRFCRVLFPAIYLLFNLYYWPYYMIWQHSQLDN